VLKDLQSEIVKKEDCTIKGKMVTCDSNKSAPQGYSFWEGLKSFKSDNLW